MREVLVIWKHLQMASDSIDIEKLERELVTALQADKKYSRENDAKLRAVQQKVQTYEEFREIVQASHLVPLDRQDLTGSSVRKQPWNMTAHSSTTTGNTITDVLQTTNQLKNAHDFTREWRKLKKTTPEEQYQFLVAIGGAQLYDLFKVEISMGLLGEFLETLNKCYKEKDCNQVYCILHQLSRTSRFKLSLSFLSQKEKEAVSALIKKLNPDSINRAEVGPTVSELGRTYGVDSITETM